MFNLVFLYETHIYSWNAPKAVAENSRAPMVSPSVLMLPSSGRRPEAAPGESVAPEVELVVLLPLVPVAPELPWVATMLAPAEVGSAASVAVAVALPSSVLQNTSA